MAERTGPDPRWSDRRLVTACLAGEERAWHVLVDKYKNLVYAVILRYGVGSQEAADVFQAVWLDAYNDLPKLRRKRALKPWLVTLTHHKCFHHQRKQARRQQHEGVELDAGTVELPASPATFDDDLARDQLVREAVFALSDRCRTMIRMLFFSFPPRPYVEVAERLGLAVGSIGFTRGRCLKQLEKELRKRGMP
ncbi:MAG: sigma-70 family RNA polymerase sigma factor [Acidobacteria bacterium]|nr:MAG: sigma-70 family RNA polymerase sigma factor [Acidobacteriota bacterium]